MLSLVDTPTFLDMLITVSIYLTLGSIYIMPSLVDTLTFLDLVVTEYLSYTRPIYGMLSLVDTPTFLNLLVIVSIYLTLGLFMECSPWYYLTFRLL